MTTIINNEIALSSFKPLDQVITKKVNNQIMVSQDQVTTKIQLCLISTVLGPSDYHKTHVDVSVLGPDDDHEIQ